MASQEHQKGHRWFAAFWNLISARYERGIGKEIRPRLMGETRGRVLEIGAGTGHSFAYYQPGAQVVATDPDIYMLRRAERKLAQLTATNIELRQASAEDLPFADGSFDHVTCAKVLCSVPDLALALSEAHRVLVPGGTLRFWEHVRNDQSVFWGTLQDLIVPVWRWFGAGCHPNRRTEQAIKDAGFQIEWLETTREAPGTPAIYGVARRA